MAILNLLPFLIIQSTSQVYSHILNVTECSEYLHNLLSLRGKFLFWTKSLSFEERYLFSSIILSYFIYILFTSCSVFVKIRINFNELYLIKNLKILLINLSIPNIEFILTSMIVIHHLHFIRLFWNHFVWKMRYLELLYIFLRRNIC